MGLSKTSLRRMLLVVVLAGFALGLVLTLHFIFKKPIRSGWTPPTASSTTVHKQEKVSSGLPVRLMIPKINVDAAIDYVGLTPEGELGVPAGPANAAWYDLGPRPGEKGNAVIDGHFGYKNHIPAVFDNLHALQKGDIIYVEDEKGKTITFVVRELRTYGQNEDDSGVFVSSDGKAHLNLITCQGVWSETQKSFSNRLVVFADEEIK
jgi:LPXTG-site transpeptidase (sortase) family protein